MIREMTSIVNRFENSVPSGDRKLLYLPSTNLNLEYISYIFLALLIMFMSYEIISHVVGIINNKL